MESSTISLMSELRKTPLNALHRRLGAKMVNFSGWDMPVEYPSSGGLIAEHKAVRGSVGVFDVSHMGDIRIGSGKKPGGALAAVQYITMNDASRLAIGQAQYSAMLYPDGAFVDDVIVHRLGEDDFLLVINAGTREKDIHWVRANTKGFDCNTPGFVKRGAALTECFRHSDLSGRYEIGMTTFVCPAELDAAITERAQKLALQVYGLLGCHGVARVDLMLEQDSGELWVLETNVVPGLTETSLLPQAADAAGIDFDALTERVLASAWTRR